MDTPPPIPATPATSDTKRWWIYWVASLVGGPIVAGLLGVGLSTVSQSVASVVAPLVGIALLGLYIAASIGLARRLVDRVSPERRLWATIGLSFALVISGYAMLLTVAAVGCVLVFAGAGAIGR